MDVDKANFYRHHQYSSKDDSSSSEIRNELPIDQLKRHLLYLLEKHSIVIVVSETGSGKSTRIPQILYSAGETYTKHDNNSRIICITQPRRVAAIQLAQRVAQELGCQLGSTVGYAVRFQDVSRPNETFIKFITEGLLLRELMFDPLLKKYSVIMIDEVHERNLNTDILLGLLKCLMLKRQNDLKLIICSATMNIETICNFFSYKDNLSEATTMIESPTLLEPAILRSSGKSYPLKICYLKEPVANYLKAAVKTVLDIHENIGLASGKILLFLTGQDEVEYVCQELREYSQTMAKRLDIRNLIVLPLHASLRSDQISQALGDNFGRFARVCVVSTNVAETSLTIDDVAYVIDCGFTKLKVFDHRTNVDSLVRVPISKCSARQRAGRAGRTRPGVVYRLYSEIDYKQLAEETRPEIQKSSLAEVVLLLKSMGVENLQKFPLPAQMPRENLISGLEILFALGAIDERGQLTEAGLCMIQFSLEPKLSRLLLAPESAQCTRELCRIVAMLEVKEIYHKANYNSSDLWSNERLKNICASEGDLVSYLNIFNGFIDNDRSESWAKRRNLNYQALLNAIRIAAKLEQQLVRCGVSIRSSNRLSDLSRALTSGLFLNAACLNQKSGEYRTLRGNQLVHVHPSSIYSELIERPKCVIFVEILNTTKIYMRHLMEIDQTLLLEVAPHFYTFATDLEMASRRVGGGGGGHLN